MEKNAHGARSEESGGCCKTVTFSSFKYCFTSRDFCTCNEALSQGRRTCLDPSFFLLLIGAHTRTCISTADNTWMRVMFSSLFESNAFKISYNTHYISNHPRITRIILVNYWHKMLFNRVFQQKYPVFEMGGRAATKRVPLLYG